VAAQGVDGGKKDAVGFVFENIAAGTGFDDLLNEFVGFMHGENENLGVGKRLVDAASSVDTVQQRHADIENQDVGLELDCFLDGFASIGGFGADFPTLAGFDQGAEAGANNSMIIRDKKPKRIHGVHP